VSTPVKVNPLGGLQGTPKAALVTKTPPSRGFRTAGTPKGTPRNNNGGLDSATRLIVNYNRDELMMGVNDLPFLTDFIQQGLPSHVFNDNN
jgi:hypothetical protein